MVSEAGCGIDRWGLILFVLYGLIYADSHMTHLHVIV
jgi:hypothetical protein